MIKTFKVTLSEYLSHDECDKPVISVLFSFRIPQFFGRPLSPDLRASGVSFSTFYFSPPSSLSLRLCQNPCTRSIIAIKK